MKTKDFKPLNTTESQLIAIIDYCKFSREAH